MELSAVVRYTTIYHGGARRVPQGGDILGQPPNGLALRGRQRHGLLPEKPAMLCLERFLGG
jgi:hypothetical protein